LKALHAVIAPIAPIVIQNLGPERREIFFLFLFFLFFFDLIFIFLPPLKTWVSSLRGKTSLPKRQTPALPGLLFSRFFIYLLTLMIEIENSFQFQEPKYMQEAGECQHFFYLCGARRVR
jgi:hypothetical protein